MKVTPTLLLDEGEYDFNIIQSSEEVSKAGNEMIKITLNINHSGKEYKINDYLLDNSKTRNIYKSVGLLDLHNTGEVTSDSLYMKKGRCIVSISRDETGRYDDKNVVKNYITKKDGDFLNDELPPF